MVFILLVVLTGCSSSRARREAATVMLLQAAGHAIAVNVDAGVQLSEDSVTRLRVELAQAFDDCRCTSGWECALMVQADFFELATALREVHFVARGSRVPDFERATGMYTISLTPGQDRFHGAFYIRDLVDQSLEVKVPALNADAKTHARYVARVIESSTPCKIGALIPVYDRLLGASLVAARLQLVRPYTFAETCTGEEEALESWYATHESTLSDAERRGVQTNLRLTRGEL